MDFLFVQGIPDNQLGTVLVDKQGGISIMVGGSSNMYPFMRGLPGKTHSFYMNNGNLPQPFQLNYWPSVIINEISDADSHVAALNRCEAFCKQQGKPVINPPALIRRTTRDGISRLLQDIPGLRVPLTVCIAPRSPDDVANAISEHAFTFPLIFRQVGDHGGVSTVLLEHAESIPAAMHAYALDGRNYYLTQYHPYAGADGLHRKFRIVMIAGRPYLRHMIVSDHWLIHSASRRYMQEHPQYQQEEAQQLASFRQTLAPRLQPTLDAITARLQLDYYGIDCSIDAHGELLVFEINANMNVLTNNQPRPNIWEKPLAEIVNAIQAMIVAKANATQQTA